MASKKEVLSGLCVRMERNMDCKMYNFIQELTDGIVLSQILM